MGLFTRVASDAFDALQLDAGVLLSNYNINNPYSPPADNDIIATTTGGINPVCTATYSDFGEDVDNVPINMMEFKHLDGWECTLGFSTIKFNAENTLWALGAADSTLLENGVVKIAPRRDLRQADFKDVWWVGDKANGGAYAVKLRNALSTSGLSIQSTKNGKGTNAITLTGHVSINNQNVMPMEFYDIPPEETPTARYSVTQNLTHVNSTFTDTTVVGGTEFTATLTAAEGYTVDDVIVIMGSENITSNAYDSATGVVTISDVTENIFIAATATQTV